MTYEVLSSYGDMLPCLREAIAGAIGLDFAPGSQSIKCNCTALGYARHTAQDSAAGGQQYKTYYGPESMWSVAGQ
jgi:hypothetical protein